MFILNPEQALRAYKDFVESNCTRTIDDHRSMPCMVLKEAVSGNTQPKCKGCKYEKGV